MSEAHRKSRRLISSMKRGALISIAVAATLALLGPAWAQEEAPPSTTDQAAAPSTQENDQGAAPPAKEADKAAEPPAKEGDNAAAPPAKEAEKVAAPEAKEKEARHESERHEQKPKRFDWSFAGAFGRYDKAQLRRGFKVYKEVCSSCHSIKMLAFRNLSQPGGPEFPEKEVEALAASYKIKDGPNQAGEYFDRPGRPSDRFPAPFANEQAARAALAGNYPPDMSVLAKARGYSRGFPLFLFDALPGFSYQEHGVDYITSLMEGYEDPPPDVKMPDGQFYDPYMPGRRIGMPPPLSEGVVTYEDGAPQTIDQYAKDVAAFMMWVAEPHLESRKRIGLGVVAFLLVFVGLLYFTKRKIWSNVPH
ncbi:cytochrome c1 [Methylocystis sp. H4A]|uniref:cytochrome c1 n=1 Tax=Methylocystis sp. H4A TaxID=2785788 RepID=UPI001FEEBD92|nr:cytochrome c1 [Methylocystis sp. H4A]